jgi:pyruvyl transferase EpsO
MLSSHRIADTQSGAKSAALVFRRICEMSDAGSDLKHKGHGMMMDGLKQRLGRIAEVMPPTRPVIYLDYPVHDNVGDLLIHQGADAFLEDYGYNVLGRFSIHDFCRTQQVGEPLVVFKPSVRDLDNLIKRNDCGLALHGGGNLGDLWPHFQMFREMLITRYHDIPIVILPQSVHFESSTGRARAAHVFGRHRQLFTFVRDVESLNFIREHCGGAGEVMPDMAHQLWGRLAFMPFVTAKPCGTLIQRRRDKERRRESATTPAAFDWEDLKSKGDVFALRALRKWQIVDNPLRHWVSNYALWRPYRDGLVRRAIDRFRSYERIDTDRLHGLILAALMSRNVRYREGTYGKLRRYAELWLAESDLIEGERSERSAA